MADDLAALLEEQQRRQGMVTGGYKSVLDKTEKPTRSEFKDAVESILKGSTKGIISAVGGWGNLYDELASAKDPSAFSTRGIVNGIARIGGPDLNKISGWEGLYKAAEAGAPAAAFSPLGGSLFKLSTPARTAAAEFATAGGLGLLGQTVAPESAGVQLVTQSLPYLVKGGVQGIKTKAAEKRIAEYRDLLPKMDQNIFDQFILKGQGSTDPAIANDILRITGSIKYGELVATLNAGASEKAIAGMAPVPSKLSNKEAAIAAAQAIQNKLSGLKEEVASSIFDEKRPSLYDKAKGYGGDSALVNPNNTLANIEALIEDFSSKKTPDAEQAVKVLQNIRNRLSPSFTTPTFGPITTTVREATPTRNIPGSPARAESYQTPVVRYDSLGMPIQEITTTNFTVPAAGGKTIAGTPSVQGVIPGGGGVTLNKGLQPMTISEVQGMLSEFGKKAGTGDQLIKDLSIGSEQRISAAIFGGIKDDIKEALKTTTGKDKAALEILQEARKRTSTAVDRYQTALAQGLPDWLKDKSIKEINFEALSAQYNKLTPEQRSYARSLISDTDAEALKALDYQTYNDFIKQAKTTNPVTGVEGIDIGLLASNWKKLKDTNPIAADNLVTALGTNAEEFSSRMKQADVFSKRMKLAPETGGKIFDNSTIRETSAAVGASPAGYSGSKLTQLGMDIANIFGKEGVLTEDQLAKLMLPKEGMDFLKNANMSPRGQKTLESLMSLDKAELPAFYQFGAQMGRAGGRLGTADQPTVEQPGDQQQQADDLQLMLQEQANRQQNMPRVDLYNMQSDRP